MEVDSNDLAARYRAMSDDSFARLHRDDLTDLAKTVYDAEVARRGPIQQEPLDPLSEAQQNRGLAAAPIAMRRTFARMIDECVIYFFVLLCSTFFLDLFTKDSSSHAEANFVTSPLFIFTVASALKIMSEAVLIANSTSPGKAIFRLRVTTPSGGPLSTDVALTRCLLVWLCLDTVPLVLNSFRGRWVLAGLPFVLAWFVWITYGLKHPGVLPWERYGVVIRKVRAAAPEIEIM